MNRRMTEKDFEELVSYLDARIDSLTKPIPGTQILRLAESIRHANSSELEDADSVDTYGDDDYSPLLEAYEIVTDQLPRILQNIRGKSIDPDTGWQFVNIDSRLYGDCGLCAICRKPYQHLNQTVKVHHLDMHENAYHGVCRECVGTYAPLEFVDLPEVSAWLAANRCVCKEMESDHKTEKQRVDLVDTVRRFAHSTHYFSTFFEKSPEWLRNAFRGEWR